MLQRLYEKQASGSDAEFYEAHEASIDYLKQQWEQYYRMWMNRVVYVANHKRIFLWGKWLPFGKFFVPLQHNFR